jgi:hypothetical protein
VTVASYQILREIGEGCSSKPHRDPACPRLQATSALRDQRASGLIEYLVLLALFALVVIVGLGLLRRTIARTLMEGRNNIATNIRGDGNPPATPSQQRFAVASLPPQPTVDESATAATPAPRSEKAESTPKPPLPDEIQPPQEGHPTNAQRVVRSDPRAQATPKEEALYGPIGTIGPGDHFVPLRGRLARLSLALDGLRIASLGLLQTVLGGIAVGAAGAMDGTVAGMPVGIPVGMIGTTQVWEGANGFVDGTASLWELVSGDEESALAFQAKGGGENKIGTMVAYPRLIASRNYLILSLFVAYNEALRNRRWSENGWYAPGPTLPFPSPRVKQKTAPATHATSSDPTTLRHRWDAGAPIRGSRQRSFGYGLGH